MPKADDPKTNDPKYTAVLTVSYEFAEDDVDTLSVKLERKYEEVRYSARAVSLTVNGEPKRVDAFLKEVEGTVVYTSKRIFNGVPPMSFQEAKTALFPYLDEPGYLTVAFLELDALPHTRAIKKAAKEHVAKAARDFAARKAERKV